MLDSKIEVTDSDVAKALKRPGSFVYSGDRPIFETWSLGPVIRHRDSDLIDESNADALVKYLESDPTLADDWEIASCSHWGVGWVKHLAYRAVEDDDQKSPTRIFRVLKEWFAKLEDYPIADEEDYDRRELEATYKNIEDAGRRFVKEDVPENWPKQCWQWFGDNDQSAIENRNGGGGEPNEKQIKEALKALGLLEEG